MRYSLLVIVVVALQWMKRAEAATLTACAYSYLTSDKTGAADNAASPYTACTTATVKTACAGGFNAQCSFSLKFYKYICCYPLAVTVQAVTGTATLPTIDPGSTRTPNNVKPVCPQGTIGFGSGSTALVCNITNLANAGCPTSYTCTKAMNVYDVSGTPTNTLDDIGAVKTPYICCKTTTATNVFSTAGLGTTLIPVPPSDTVLSVFFGSTPAAAVYIGDDYSTTGISYLTLGAAPNDKLLLQKITLYTTTALQTADGTRGVRYHALFYDSSTNKDCIFIGNIAGATVTADKPNPTLAIADPLVDITATAAGGVPVDNQAAMVWLDSTTTPATPTYKYSVGSVWKGLASPTATATHKWVLLVWSTPSQLDFGPVNAGAADETKILLGKGAFSDFVPTTDTTSGTGPGKFTTVTAFLSLTKVKTILGTPIAGTYFYMKN